jgi:tetratricopeptide (TPR) repeat protein
MKDAAQLDRTQNQTAVKDFLQEAYSQIAAQQLSAATEALERALSVDFENTDVVTAMKYVSFWADRQETVETLADPFEQGEYLLDQWRVFRDFARRIGEQLVPAVDAIRSHVFRQALQFYREVYQERANRDADLLVRIGRCYKGTGEFDRALRFVQAAGAQRSESAEILAELADLFALVNEIAKAKALFREAFFLNAQSIDLSRLESELISRVIHAVSERGYVGRALKEWIPVYGVLFGVLNVKRELRSIEYGRLKQSIYLLERELREGTGEDEIVKPRLINRYFWLIDHYAVVHEAQSKIDEVLLKIRSVDSDVYHQYTK